MPAWVEPWEECVNVPGRPPALIFNSIKRLGRPLLSAHVQDAELSRW
jgi:hypothetical protein